MTLLTGFKALAVAAVGLALSTLTTAIPYDDDWNHPTPSTCKGTPYTTFFVTTSLITTYTTISVPTTSYIPHHCYTYYVATAQSNNAFCGTTSLKCPPHPMCIVRSTTTAPCKDPCCPTTPTVTSLGGCATCQTGCATEWVTVTRSTDCQATNTPS